MPACKRLYGLDLQVCKRNNGGALGGGPPAKGSLRGTAGCMHFWDLPSGNQVHTMTVKASHGAGFRFF